MTLTNTFEHSAASQRTAFDIGHDFAFYRLSAPSTSCQDVLKGFANKKRQGGSTRRSTHSIRKWLNLRLHAYERKIHIDESITPDLLESMFIETGGICPVTNEAMTAGTKTESDWSVDRLMNDFGYLADNIAIMSTRANTAKGCLSLEEIKTIRDRQTAHRGLTYKQWSNLYSLVSKVATKLGCIDNLKDLNLKAFNADIILRFIDTMTDPFRPEDDTFISISTCIAMHTKPKNQKTLRRTLLTISKRRNTDDTLENLMKHSARLRREINNVCKLVDWDDVLGDIDRIRQLQVAKLDRMKNTKRL